MVLLHKEGHLTELLLVKMTDDWRRTLANIKTVRIIFVDYKKAFHSIFIWVTTRVARHKNRQGHLVMNEGLHSIQFQF